MLLLLLLFIKFRHLLLSSLLLLASLTLYQVEGQLLDCSSSSVNNSYISCSSQVPAETSVDEVIRVVRHVSSLNYDENTGCRNESSSCNTSNNPINSKRKRIEVFIRSPNNATQFKPGSPLTIECRFDASQTDNEQDFKFNLRWLRLVAGSSANQSIAMSDSAPETSDPSSLTILASVARIWTVQRSGGLDLEFMDFQPSDAGNYFCQAVSQKSSKEESIEQQHKQQQTGNLEPGETILSEARIKLELAFPTEQHLNINHDRPQPAYSQDSLSKLMPSLKVFPDFSEVAAGETIQLACLTSELDPDPEPSEIGWSFEWMSADRSHLQHSSPIARGELPKNVSVIGNILVVWSMNEDHCGLYRCSVRLAEFNLTVQATGELTLRPTNPDSAPLVFVSPELVRLSPNGSATIQCEATGYPAPELSWYRVEQAGSAPSPVEANSPLGEEGGSRKLAAAAAGDALDGIAGIEIERIAYKDAQFYCEHSQRCLSNQAARSGRVRATGINLIHLQQARAQHQGQYVCRASNQHGSNQASAIVDVEFREPPIVRIVPELREQAVELKGQSSEANVTFKCSIESGRPKPKLRWLRATTTTTGASQQNQLNQADNLDIYDLTRVSSATANLSTWTEDNGKSLMLRLSTISLDDEGEYVCLGENEWGRHSEVARLTIRQPVSVKILQTSPLMARTNDSFHLDCIASGHPLPLDIEWSRSDRGAFFSLISRSSGGGGQERALLKFDRVSSDESGEYTCNARDPLNPSLTLRDTIMVLVDEHQRNLDKPDSEQDARSSKAWMQPLLPKLMVRPTKVNAPLGSNLTLDCLAVSGLQPTIVEWIAPPPFIGFQSNATLPLQTPSAAAIAAASADIRPYYWGRTSGQLLQFGSKLKILNVSRAHEGVYQCKGKNKMGVENAPALVRVLEQQAQELARSAYPKGSVVSLPDTSDGQPAGSVGAQTRTKVAKLGSNIELKCQVNGVEQPATSWSRDRDELPPSSVQIGHNLWIQNVTSKDNGLYICSARSKQPNKVIQAKINLLVGGIGAPFGNLSTSLSNLSAKIVASKSAVNIGDSITLECIVSSTTMDSKANSSLSARSAFDLEEVERNVVWTNLHSGQTLFQDNVYIQYNLLIIYELRPENSAIYRCNYNDLSQHTDYKLQVIDTNSSDWLTGANSSKSSLGGGEQQKSIVANMTFLIASNGRRAELRQVALGSQLSVECIDYMRSSGASQQNYYWLRGSGESGASERRRVGQENSPLTFDSIRSSEADIYSCFSGPNQLEPAHSVIVQVLLPVARFAQMPVSFITLPTVSGADHQLDIELKFLPERDTGLILFNGQQQLQSLRPTASAPNRSSILLPGDYILLGLQRGHLEFRFELGDGATLLRSLQPLSLNQWHKVVIERNRRGAVMWLDKQPPVSNSSTGKFFNLNLDSVLYIGGNQFFMSANRSSPASSATRHHQQQQQDKAAGSQQQQQDKAAGSQQRFYGYSRGFQGCISLLRISRNEINLMARNRSAAIGIFECDKPECKASECNQQHSVCQVDRSLLEDKQRLDPTRRASASADMRCICLPGSIGERCDRRQIVQHSINATEKPEAIKQQLITSTVASTTTVKQSGACELLEPCSSNGTLKCQSLTSTSFRCHCRLGFVGDSCAQTALFANETSVRFNQQAYLHFRLNKPEEALAYLRQQPQQQDISESQFNSSSFADSIQMADKQNISFGLQTKSSYGLIFYMGQPVLGDQSAQTGAIGAGQQTGFGQIQTSKSIIANLLARLSNTVSDYLAIGLVDGHVELSYELGSGVAIIRSTKRINDGERHQIRVLRAGKNAKLIVDESHKHEGNSPGKLSVLNAPADIYLGGLPYLSGDLFGQHNAPYLSGFAGCLSQLELNSLGPVNLIRSNHLDVLLEAQNLAPCQSAPKPSREPPGGSGSGGADSDDSDEM